MLLTFSGLDGSGKSTLIEILTNHLQERKYSVKVLNMYDHIGVYALLRYIRDAVIGSPSKNITQMKFGHTPEEIKDTENHNRIMCIIIRVLRHSWMKKIVFLLDIFLMYGYRLYFEGICRHVLILDRYFYDSVVDILIKRPEDNFTNFMLQIIPTPTLSIFIDVPPKISYNRKGEFTIDYLENRYSFYCSIFSKNPDTVFLFNLDKITAKEELYEKIIQPMFS